MNGETDDLKKKKGLTWAEAAQVVLERSARPMTHKEILKVIQNEELRDVSKGSAPLACLNAMLHHHSRGPNDVFYKVDGRMSCYGINLDRVEIPEDQQSGDKEDEDIEEMSEDTLEPSRSSDSDDEPLVYAKNGGSRAASHQLLEERSKSGGVQGREESLPRKRITRPKPNGDPPSKRPRVSSRPRPVPKTVLKNLKVGNPSDGNSRNLGHNAVKKSSSQGLIPPMPSRNPVTGQFQSRSSTNADIKTAQDIAKTQGLWMKKPRRYKKVSFAAQMKRTQEGRVDLQTPDSVLVNVPLRTLINQRTFNLLPPAYQYQLLRALPKVDRHVGPDQISRPSHTCFNNEFFTSASQSWRDRLQEGEFMNDVQPTPKSEEIKVDPWKAKFFEPIWGQSTLPEEPESPPLPDYMLCPDRYGPDSYAFGYMDNSLDERNSSPRGAGSFMKSLTVPVKGLPAHQLNRNTTRARQQKVSASRRSEAAKQLSRAYIQSQKLNVVVINLVTPAIASSAVSAVRTVAPTNTTSTQSSLSKKQPIKPPCETPASDNTSATQSRDLPLPFSATSQTLNELGLPHAPGSTPRTITRTSMLKASRSNAQASSKSKAKLTSTNALKTPVTATVPLKNFGKSVLLRNCSCTLRAMLVCRSCGAFCHHDCISTAQLCGACVN